MSEVMFPSIVTNINGHDQSTNIINYDFERKYADVPYLDGEDEEEED